MLLAFSTNSHSPLCNCFKCILVSRINKNSCTMQNKNAKDIGTMKTAETELENVILLILLINFCKLAGTLAIEGKVISIFDNESMQRYSEYI